MVRANDFEKGFGRRKRLDSHSDLLKHGLERFANEVVVVQDEHGQSCKNSLGLTARNFRQGNPFQSERRRHSRDGRQKQVAVRTVDSVRSLVPGHIYGVSSADHLHRL